MKKKYYHESFINYCGEYVIPIITVDLLSGCGYKTIILFTMDKQTELVLEEMINENGY